MTPCRKPLTSLQRSQKQKRDHDWYMRNRDAQLQKHKEWRQQNRKKYLKYQKEYRKTHRDKNYYQRIIEYRQKYPHIVKAHTEIYRLWQQGIINKQEPCAICGKKSEDCHHFDYSLPLCVVHLCKDCHRQLHNDDILNKKIKEVYIYEPYVRYE